MPAPVTFEMEIIITDMMIPDIIFVITDMIIVITDMMIVITDIVSYYLFSFLLYTYTTGSHIGFKILDRLQFYPLVWSHPARPSERKKYYRSPPENGY